MSEPTPALPDGLVRYFAAMEQQRADWLTGRLARFGDQGRTLVREAAVMGWVLGVMHAGGKEHHIPHDAEIVSRVLLGCRSQPDLYPLIGEHVEDDDEH